MESGSNQNLVGQSLFGFSGGESSSRPLADRLRPRQLQDFMGHEEWLAPGKPLRKMIEAGRPRPLILWGPPGSGKTTFAKIIAATCQLTFENFSAVTSGIKDVKVLMEQARIRFQQSGLATVLFVDEIHRFNRSQQDAFLPYVESGEIVLIGATTENPSFELNAALLSRLQVIVFQPLAVKSIRSILDHAFVRDARVGRWKESIPSHVLDVIAAHSQGDARSALNQLESLVVYCEQQPDPITVTVEMLSEILSRIFPKYDKSGENHYDMISALHKSLRNSDTQASLYWMLRMVDGGEDPLFIARRLVRFASEDIGLAEPEALTAALNAQQAVSFIGMPEAKLALAQAVVVLATAPKSNALYKAVSSLENAIETGHRHPVPYHLRNAPTRLMKNLKFGEGYQYAHDAQGKTTGMTCMPEPLKNTEFYRPGTLGHEKVIAKRMDYWRQLRSAGDQKIDGTS